MMNTVSVYERTPKLEAIDREIQDVQKRMLRFIETGDLMRLARLKERLSKLQVDLDF
jgi:hypothetical protein